MAIRRLAGWGWGLLLALGASAPAFAQVHPVENVAPGAIEAWVAASKGIVMVNVTSTDPRCGYCAQANVKFDQMSRRHDMDADFRLVQVAWQPWTRFPPEIQPFLDRYGITGIPVKLIFEDGKFERKETGVPADLAPESPRRVTGNIALVDRRQVADKVARSRGVVVVQLTSFDTTCAFCMRSNPIFEELVRTNLDPNVTFLRVDYLPWTGVSRDPFARSIGSAGLPVYLTYQDGKQVRSKPGSWDVVELRKVLLDGLQ
jgi:thiol-disulfide isomerase/thioredoxin